MLEPELLQVLGVVAKQLAASLSEIADRISKPAADAKTMMQILEDRHLVKGRAVPGSDEMVYTLTPDGRDLAEGTARKRVSSLFDRVL